MHIFKILNAFILKNKPIYIHYGITHRCNINCRMCKIHQDARVDDELSLEKIDRIFDVIKTLGVVYVSIGGGEPLLRKDIFLVIELLKKKGFIIRLLSNGLLIENDSAKELIAAGLRDISISLDTLDPKKQDYLNNTKGAWPKIVKSIKLFSDILPEKGRLLLINTVVSPFNIEELPEISLFAKKMGYYVSFIPIEDNGSSEFKFTQNEHKQIDKTYNRLIKMKSARNNNIFNSSKFLEKSWQYLKFNKSDWRCDAGKLYFSINPRGELSICHRFSPELSLLGANIKNFYNSKEFKNKRYNLAGTCSGCMRPCWAEVSFSLSDRKSLLEMAKIRFLQG